jgi:phosphatidylglycerol:prolipoprotein diacylglycerol transferase
VTVYPFTLHLGPVELTGYGLMMMAGFLMAGWTIQLDLRGRGLAEEYAGDVVLAAVIGGLVGAKLWYVALTGGGLFSRGGFVWYGGFFGGVAGVMLVSHLRRVPIRYTMDLCAAPLAVGYALGRVGCFMVNDDYGLPSSVPWAMKFPQGLPPSTVSNLAGWGVTFPPGTDPNQVVAVHPTQLYETIAMFAVFTWLWRRRAHAHGHGWLFGAYLVLAGAERFLVEFVRAKDDRLLGAFTVAQVASIVLVLAGGSLLYAWRAADPAAGAPEVLSRKPASAAS